MIISEVNYSQNIGEYDEWYLKDMRLGKLNLIASKNAVGKTRTCNVLSHFTAMLSGKQRQLSNGNFDIVFKHNKVTRKYKLITKKNRVVEESLVEGKKFLIRRSAETGEIVHFRNGKRDSQVFYPPPDKLTNQVRRDVKELVYLEELTRWAENFHLLTFSHIRMDIVPLLIENIEEANLFTDDLALVPFMLQKMVSNTEKKGMIIRDLNYAGYEIKDMDVSIPNIPKAPKDSLVIRLWEKGLKHPIDQMSFSQGMHRVIAIIITVHYLLEKGGGGTVVCDDFAEGLDFERATKLTEVVFKRMQNADGQLIVTSNDRFLMNAVDIKYWNILERRKHTVQSFNYINSEKSFDEFRRAGLNNFDFFANQLYKGLADD